MLSSFEPDDVVVEANVPLTELLAFGNPLDGDEWDCAPVSIEDVMACVARGDLETEPWQVVNLRYRGQSFDDGRFHVRRVAYFVANVDDEPLDIESDGISDRFSDQRRVRVFDGNHRLAGVALRGVENVRVRFADHCQAELKRLMPGLARRPSPSVSSTSRSRDRAESMFSSRGRPEGSFMTTTPREMPAKEYTVELVAKDGSTPLGEPLSVDVMATDHVVALTKALALHPRHEACSWGVKAEIEASRPGEVPPAEEEPSSTFRP